MSRHFPMKEALFEAVFLSRVKRVGELLARAQQARAVRHDIDTADVMALIAGCLARESGPGNPAARDRLLSVIREGLRPSR